jgi:Spy/CpxP family protein refolding chaperone
MLRSTIALAALSLGLVAAPAAVSAQSAAPTDSAPAAAQAAGQHRHHHPLFRGITLSSDQKTQLKAIRAKYGPQIKQARQANDRQTAHQLRGQMVSEARGVLTPDQQQKFDANLAALKQRHKSAPTAAPAPSPTPSSAS